MGWVELKKKATVLLACGIKGEDLKLTEWRGIEEEFLRMSPQVGNPFIDTQTAAELQRRGGDAKELMGNSTYAAEDIEQRF